MRTSNDMHPVMFSRSYSTRYSHIAYVYLFFIHFIRSGYSSLHITHHALFRFDGHISNPSRCEEATTLPDAFNTSRSQIMIAPSRSILFCHFCDNFRASQMLLRTIVEQEDIEEEGGGRDLFLHNILTVFISGPNPLQYFILIVNFKTH